MGKADVFTGMSLTEKLIWLKKFSNGGGTPTYEDRTASGNPVIITTNFAQNAKALSASFSPKQNLNGYDYPWFGGAGKNLVGLKNLTYGKSISSAGAIVNYSVNRCATVGGIKIDNTKKYIFSSKSDDVKLIYAVFNGSTLVRRTAGVSSGTSLNVSGGNIMYLCFYTFDGSTYDNRKVLPNDDKIQVEQSDTATTYEPYENICPITGIGGLNIDVNGTTIPVTWTDKERVTYGGIVNVVSGVLTITHSIAVISENSEVAEASIFHPNYIPDRIRVRCYAHSNFNARCADVISDRMQSFCIEGGWVTVADCPQYASATAKPGYFGNYSTVSNAFWMWLPYGGSDGVQGDTVEDIKAWLALNPLTFISKRINQTIYQLTPQQVALIVGQNVIATDADSLNVTYKVKV